MSNKKLLRYLLISISISLISCSQSNSESTSKEISLDASIDSEIKTFFSKYKNEGVSAAIDFIFQYNLDVSHTQVNELKDQLSRINSLVGNFNGQEEITTQKIGKSLIYCSYLVKNEKNHLDLSSCFTSQKTNG